MTNFQLQQEINEAKKIYQMRLEDSNEFEINTAKERLEALESIQATRLK